MSGQRLLSMNQYNYIFEKVELHDKYIQQLLKDYEIEKLFQDIFDDVRPKSNGERRPLTNKQIGWLFANIKNVESDIRVLKDIPDDDDERRKPTNSEKIGLTPLERNWLFNHIKLQLKALDKLIEVKMMGDIEEHQLDCEYEDTEDTTDDSDYVYEEEEEKTEKNDKQVATTTTKTTTIKTETVTEYETPNILIDELKLTNGLLLLILMALVVIGLELIL